MPPFPLCCLAGLWSTEAAAAFAAMSSGLAAGAAANTACTVTPQYKDGATPVADLVAAHQKQQGRVERMQQPLVVLGVAAAAAAASSTARGGSHAAAPLAISAAVSAGTIVWTLALMRPVDKAIGESRVAAAVGSPGKKPRTSAADEASARELLVKWTGLNKLRSAALVAAFGAAVCGTLLVNRPVRA